MNACFRQFGVWGLAALLGLSLALSSPVEAANKSGAKSSSEPGSKAGKKTVSKKSKAVASKKSAKSKSARKSAAARAALAAYEAKAEAAHVQRVKASGSPADALGLRSNVALVVDQATGEVLISKNVDAVHPIASITKLMTALVVLDAQLPLSKQIEITEADFDTEKGTRSRLKPGHMISRNDLLHLALMASENRAAHALGRSHPMGVQAFVEAMNEKARELGMTQTRFVDPTGLSSSNVSSAHDLIKLVRAANRYHLIRQYSTNGSYQVELGGRLTGFHNTNSLVAAEGWDIGLSKTGFINEAGRCLVMHAKIDGRPMVIVLLDSWGKLSRIGDANRIKKYLTSSIAAPRNS